MWLFAVVSVLWGVPYLFIAVALDSGFTPQSVVASRVVVGAAALVLLTGGGPVVGLIRQALGRVFLVAIVEVLVPFSLIAWGERDVDSSAAGVLIALEPLFVVLWTAVVVRQSQDWKRTLTGSVLGVLGVGILLGSPNGGSGALLIVAAAASYALGATLIGRWFRDVPPMTLSAAMLALSVPPVVLLAALSGQSAQVGVPGLLAVAALGAFCTAGGFVAFFALVVESGAHTASLITYAAPLVALSAGVLAHDEALTLSTVWGTALILAAAALCLWKRERHGSAEASPGRA